MSKKPVTKKEETAKAKAEKLFGSTLHESQVPPAMLGGTSKDVERTLEQRLEDIDRRAKQRAAEEKAQLAKHYLIEAQATFKRLLSLTKDEELKAAYEAVLKFEKLVGGGSPEVGGAVSSGKKKRTQEELKADAAKAVAFLKDHPNSKASEVKSVVDFGLSLKEFIHKYSDAKVITEGSLSSMSYSVK